MTENSDPLLSTLVEISRRFGADPALVLAGGGNTSAKTDERLLVKASGCTLATAGPEDFVEMDRAALEALAKTELSSDPEAREAAFKEAILAARTDPASTRRPSVECLLHHLLPGRFVLHAHPTIANALTCCVKGEELARELLGDDVLWLPFVDPGYTLARALREALARPDAPAAPRVVLMENHGLIVTGDDSEELARALDSVLAPIAARLGPDWRETAFGVASAPPADPRVVERLAPVLRGLLAGDGPLPVVRHDDSPEVRALVNAERGRELAEGGPLTPDQIVYCDSEPLWIEPPPGADEPALALHLRGAVREHEARTGRLPKVVLVRGVGLLAVGPDARGAETVRALYRDATAVMAGATALGGIQPLSDERRRFIEEWEVEAYRRQVAAGGRVPGRAAGRVAGKVALVTGAAQGFGLEIAQALAAEGAHVVLADLQEQAVLDAAAALCDEHGPHRALGLALDVTDRASVEAAVHAIVRDFGGLDLVVSNAGVLRAESVKTQPEGDFRLVTEVNYLGYFLVVQAVAPVLARQHAANPRSWSDIVQINSKSGLVGSNRNGAYAGSKFGGIGLTQSFALELIEDGIKVNSICPGNFFDGPLWSDPDEGLFVQYLRAGKVPGATTVEDVRRAYEAKVPMGRGCRTEDVMRALYYLLEQEYETGQALPVTGGQVMLH